MILHPAVLLVLLIAELVAWTVLGLLDRGGR